MMTPDPYQILLASTARHEVTILADDGIYRHVRFAKPGTGIWRLDLVTWPGHLVITGDLEDLHFSRIDDMFEFFRSRPGYINEDYWAEKLRGPVQVKKYSPDVAKQTVVEAFMEERHSRDEAAPLWRAIRERLLDEYILSDEGLFRDAVTEFRHDGFEFYDAWEWDLREYDYHYLVALHAIVWGINQYDRAIAAMAGGE